MNFADKVLYLSINKLLLSWRHCDYWLLFITFWDVIMASLDPNLLSLWKLMSQEFWNWPQFKMKPVSASRPLFMMKDLQPHIYGTRKWRDDIYVAFAFLKLLFSTIDSIFSPMLILFIICSCNFVWRISSL